MPIYLESYTKKQLLEKANRRGKKSFSNLTKSQLIDLLRSGRTYYNSPKNSKRSGRTYYNSPKNSKRYYGSKGYSPSNEVFNNSTLRNNKIVIVGKEKCPHCNKAKELLDNKEKKYKYIEYDNLDQGSKDKISEYTKNYTKVPMIFLNEEFIGGFSDLKNLK